MKRIFLGNEAIARGLLEKGCCFLASYPGTPASEILSAFVRMAQAEKSPAMGEWSINEKVAFETALTVSWTGGRAAVSMKQVGLNVACDPLMSSAYTGVKGGFLVIPADDPGPHSSQTEQDSRMMAMLAKIPVLDPSTPEEAKQMIGLAYRISEEQEIPVMLRPTTRICHTRQAIDLGTIPDFSPPSGFPRDPHRWAATPKYRLLLHAALNRKIEAIRESYGREAFRHVLGNRKARRCIISSGVALAHAYDILLELSQEERIALYQVTMPYPLHVEAMLGTLDAYEEILVIEETYPVIEMQLARRGRIKGRLDGSVPNQGELVPDVMVECIQAFSGLPLDRRTTPEDKMRRPTLCPGCPHRSVFYAMRKAFPKGIYPSDIGCYTLGLNLGAVDTCLCMGGAISQAAGFYHAHRMRGESPPILATIGDSTFYHAGIPPLVNAVHTGARFVLLILDNGTTAMTGDQPTPGIGRLADGRPGKPVLVEDLVKASGVEYLKIVDPYRFQETLAILKDADRFARSPEGGVAVVITRHPCLMSPGVMKNQMSDTMEIGEECVGCQVCVRDFECPAILFDETQQKAKIDPTLCSGCGVCADVCPTQAIRKKGA